MKDTTDDTYCALLKKHLMLPDAFGNCYSEVVADEIVENYRKLLENDTVFLMPPPDIKGVSTYADVEDTN